MSSIREQERKKKWYEENCEKSKEAARLWQKTHPERYNEIARFSYRKRKAEGKVIDGRASSAKWRKLHPERHCQIQANRRARVCGAEGVHILAEWKQLLSDLDYICALQISPNCPIDLTDKTATRDHIISLEKGGSNYIENIQPACKSCNSQKGVRNVF
jgi:5-methylcytosine-specific restriction endonuclease McrA